MDTIEEMHWFWHTEIMARSSVRGYTSSEVPPIFIQEGRHTAVRIVNDTEDYPLNLIRRRRRR